jgi:hypothetical protein
MSWLKEAAFWNILLMSSIRLVSAQARGWPPLLKAVAPRNMLAMVVTALVSHELMSWLKTVAPRNMSDMVITAPVSQSSGKPPLLKAVAPWNIPLVFLTLPTSQELMSWLKFEVVENMYGIAFTLLVFQELMS